MSAHAEARFKGITATLMGGLGNQLFQYSAARSVAHLLECPVFVDVSRLGVSLAGDTSREFELEWLVDPEQVISTGHNAKASRIARRLIARLDPTTRTGTFQEAGFPYDDRVLNIQIGTTLVGYFQSWRYFDDIASSLRTEFHRKAPRSPWFDSVMHEFENSGPCIAVHVRRGDYLRSNNSAYHGLLGPDYYKTALEVLSTREVSGRLAVFSDEPDLALQVLGDRGDDAYVVRAPQDAHPMESIALMSRCSAVVTANSSFSWWGAWLADPALTTVVSPAPWMANPLLDDRDLRPTKWLTVSADFRES